jgi:hypothetical protein
MDQASQRLDDNVSAARERAQRLQDAAEKAGADISGSEGAAKARQAAQEAAADASEFAKEAERMAMENDTYRASKERLGEAAAGMGKAKMKLDASGLTSGWGDAFKELFNMEGSEKKVVLNTAKPKPKPKHDENKHLEDDHEFTGEGELVVVAKKADTWQQMSETLQDVPLIADFLSAAKEAGKTDAGKKIKGVKTMGQDKIEDAREFWETSQNPWVYRASSVYDGLFGETETAAAIRELRRADPDFNMTVWQEAVEQQIIHQVITASMSNDRYGQHVQRQVQRATSVPAACPPTGTLVFLYNAGEHVHRQAQQCSCSMSNDRCSSVPIGCPTTATGTLVLGTLLRSARRREAAPCCGPALQHGPKPPSPDDPAPPPRSVPPAAP